MCMRVSVNCKCIYKMCMYMNVVCVRTRAHGVCVCVRVCVCERERERESTRTNTRMYNGEKNLFCFQEKCFKSTCPGWVNMAYKAIIYKACEHPLQMADHTGSQEKITCLFLLEFFFKEQLCIKINQSYRTQQSGSRKIKVLCISWWAFWRCQQIAVLWENDEQL